MVIYPTTCTTTSPKPKREDVLGYIFETARELVGTKWYQSERGNCFENLKELIDEYETILKGEETQRDIKRQQGELEAILFKK